MTSIRARRLRCHRLMVLPLWGEARVMWRRFQAQGFKRYELDRLMDRVQREPHEFERFMATGKGLPTCHG